MALDQKTRRIELHEILCEVLGSDHVYFQPPESVKMRYPAIVYHRTGGKQQYADDMEYAYRRQYTVTIIDRDPDSMIVDRLRKRLPYCSEGTPYTADNLHHDVVTIYF